jgi:hypothetical protein
MSKPYVSDAEEADSNHRPKMLPPRRAAAIPQVPKLLHHSLGHDPDKACVNPARPPKSSNGSRPGLRMCLRDRNIQSIFAAARPS